MLSRPDYQLQAQARTIFVVRRRMAVCVSDEKREKSRAALRRWIRKTTTHADHEQGLGGIRWGAEMLRPIAVRNATKQSPVFLSTTK